MPAVIKLGDQNELVPASSFPDYANFSFDEFNPVQSRAYEIYNRDCNAIIASSTSSGKTAIAEMFLSNEVRERGGKGLYLSPLKALAQEKIDDWSSDDHHFKDLKISICTGDYRITEDRKKELADANLILMTSEMLSHRCRNHKSEGNNFLSEVGTLIVDEFHLIGVDGRGDHLEAALMKFTQVNPNIRLVFLSATMPNVDQIGEWVSYELTKKETYLIESSYRPCPLTIHYEKYYDGDKKYEDRELHKVAHALQVVEDYPDDKFLVFSHTKRTGRYMKTALERAGINCGYHNADLTKAKRLKLEKDFKEDSDLRVLVATSTVAWGLNLPARRVVILGVHRGLSQVENYDIQQMSGRAGRPKYDPSGDVYILVPESQSDHYVKKLNRKQNIESQMLDTLGGHHKIMAFHVVSEIHHGSIRNKDDFHEWYARSLAAFQSMQLDDDVVDQLVDLLLKKGIIREYEGEYKVNAVGKISSMFYFDPFDVADLRRNFSSIFENNRQDNDYAISMALASVESCKLGIVSKNEEEEMGPFSARIRKMFGNIKKPVIKSAYAYHLLLKGLTSQTFNPYMRGLQMDFPRLATVLKSIDSMSAKWDQKEWLGNLQTRVVYGVDDYLVGLCNLPHIGKVRANKLWNSNIRSYRDVVNKSSLVSKILRLDDNKTKEVIQKAKSLYK